MLDWPIPITLWGDPNSKFRSFPYENHGIGIWIPTWLSDFVKVHMLAINIPAPWSVWVCAFWRLCLIRFHISDRVMHKCCKQCSSKPKNMGTKCCWNMNLGKLRYFTNLNLAATKGDDSPYIHHHRPGESHMNPNLCPNMLKTTQLCRDSYSSQNNILGRLRNRAETAISPLIVLSSSLLLSDLSDLSVSWRNKLKTDRADWALWQCGRWMKMTVVTVALVLSQM